MTGLDAAIGTAENYGRFALREAAGRSPAYEQLTLAVAGDDLVLSFLEGAIGAARRQPPRIYRGDLLDDLARVAARAPADATLVVYHSAVLAYVDPPKRQAFGAAVRELGAVWLSNEGSGVLPGLVTDSGPASFLLVRDGDEVVARTDPHGTWLEWLA